ncbi:Mor transcription activator family protein [Thiocystis violacea]|uniref:Mor transcription activator family protein n=1 Tax=Thiocystis violacea TaxID=13725 RepID=UPI0019032965|nr:Mor transcription activator family protein [Thiocystis violacea]
MPLPANGITECVQLLRIAIEDALQNQLPADRAEEVADRAAHSFVSVYGGSVIYVPLAARFELPRRNAAIYSAWLEERFDRPAAIKQLCRKHGLSENQIYKVIRQERLKHVRAKQADADEIQTWRHDAA